MDDLIGGNCEGQRKRFSYDDIDIYQKDVVWFIKHTQVEAALLYNMHYDFNVYEVSYVAYDADSVDEVAVSVDLKGLDFWIFSLFPSCIAQASTLWMNVLLL